MKKFVLLLFITTMAFAVQPRSVHYSALGKYLVNENGNRTKIQGHPLIVCYQGSRTIRGKFLKEVNGVVYLMSDYKTIIQIDKPVCDILK